MSTDTDVASSPAPTTAREIPCTASPRARALLEQLGRTEDVRFSPDNRRLAVTAFYADVIALFDVEVGTGPDDGVVLGDAVALRAPALSQPHGVEFLDDRTIVVANRGARVSVHTIPGPSERSERSEPSAPFATVHVATLLDDGLGVVQPGSVRRDTADGASALLLCDNLGGAVTRHRVGPADGVALGPGDAVLDRWLDVPDGLALSADGRWLAVSNHGMQAVMVYERGPAGGPDPEPVAVLRGASYPHGLHFTADARHLFVADAGQPFLHVYAAGPDGWAGASYPVASHRVMDDATFLRGRHNPQEGGPKGLDLDRTGRVVVVTSEHQPLAFFDAEALRAARGDAGDRRRLAYEIAALEHAAGRIQAVGIAHQHAADAALRASAAEARAAQAEEEAAAARRHAEELAARVDAYERTKVLRLTRPLRRLYRAWRTRRAPDPARPDRTG